jgi:hypothetical protein
VGKYSPFMTDSSLAHEWRVFACGLAILVTTAGLYRILHAQVASHETWAIGVLLTLLARIVAIYLVFRFSRFLGQAIWLTMLYCGAAAVGAFLVWIPVIALLTAYRNARRNLKAQAPVVTQLNV